VLVGLVAGLASGYGCGGGTPLKMPMSGASGSSPGTAGTGAADAAAGATGTAGVNATGTAGMGAAGTGTAGITGAAGATGTAGAAGNGAAGTTGAAGTAGTAGTGAAGTTGAAGAGGSGGDITKVLPTLGCGKDPGQAIGTLVRGTIATMGTKRAGCADSKCGAWSYLREYYLQLPTGYDKTKAYPLLFEGPGCGGKGNNLYALPDLASTVIRVGLSPSVDAQAFHATNPGQGCFDWADGDNSVDWVFYENLYDQLAGQLCFDKNRVFASGNSSGAMLANELGCKYAGDATRPVRGIMPYTGGLPTDPRYVPTCANKPMAGMWVHEVADGTYPFTGSIVAMNRALTVNGCTPAGVTYQTAAFDPFPISAADSTSCKKYRDCPALYPLVVCPLPDNGKSDHSSVVNPGWATFLKLFSAPPLLTP
jgi:hypothetical protein